jgi:hypothetical protein
MEMLKLNYPKRNSLVSYGLIEMEVCTGLFGKPILVGILWFQSVLWIC